MFSQPQLDVGTALFGNRLVNLVKWLLGIKPGIEARYGVCIVGDILRRGGVYYCLSELILETN